MTGPSCSDQSLRPATRESTSAGICPHRACVGCVFFCHHFCVCVCVFLVFVCSKANTCKITYTILLILI